MRWPDVVGRLSAIMSTDSQRQRRAMIETVYLRWLRCQEAVSLTIWNSLLTQSGSSTACTSLRTRARDAVGTLHVRGLISDEAD
jgi:hypothetical protein